MGTALYAALLALRRTESRWAAEDRDRRVAESPASRQTIGWLPTRLQLGDAVRLKSWSPASLPSVGTPKKRGSAVLPNRLPLVRLSLALDKAATRRRRQAQTLESSITAKRRTHLVCALSFVVRLQMLLRLGVRAVTPLITTLLSTFYGFTDDPAPSES